MTILQACVDFESLETIAEKVGRSPLYLKNRAIPIMVARVYWSGNIPMFQNIRISGTGQERIGRRAVGFVQGPFSLPHSM